MAEKRTILVTNDDGITSNGIAALVEVASEFGEVVVVAPNSAQSGVGHAITMRRPLRLRPVKQFGKVAAYSCDGTPVDCVKLAVDKVLLHHKPVLCVSGINHGSNASINVIYSGTMSAAMEAAIEGINSVGFSSLNYKHNADMDTAQLVARKVIKNVLQNGLPKHQLLNVNIPNVKPEHLAGIKVCKQAKGLWKEEFEERNDPFNRPYYWLTGKFVCEDKDRNTDIWALNHNYASIVPVQFDLTEYEGIKFINENWNIDVKS